MTYKILNIDGYEWWYRITGNGYGWNLFIQKPSTPQMPIRNYVKYPFWEQPTNKTERKEFYENLVREYVSKHGREI
mgnify:FL=1